MQDSELTNFGTWLHDNEDKCFRYWVYKKVFTPYEQSEKFMDESMFEDAFANNGYIKEAIELPDGDILLGIQDACTEDYIEYYRLSEIRLAYTSIDAQNFEMDEEDNNEEWF